MCEFFDRDLKGIDIQQTLALAATSLSTMASQADAKSKANKPIPGPSSTGEKNERDTSEDSSAGTVNNLQHVVNVRGLALLEEYCCAFRPVDGDRDPSIPGGSSDNSGTFPASGSGSVFSTGSAAAMAKEQHDRYRSSLPSPSHEKMKNKKLVSRAASTTRNLSIAMHMTSAATSAAGSAVRAYGASYFKGNHENEKSNRSPGSSSLQMSLSSHPLLEELTEMILTSSNINSKNVDMLVAVERVCVMLGGCRVTFCKSGKDRTGMAVTYEQSRQLGERFGCGQSTQRILKDANIMRYTFFSVSSYLIFSFGWSTFNDFCNLDKEMKNLFNGVLFFCFVRILSVQHFIFMHSYLPCYKRHPLKKRNMKI